jgi:hypothetical protein
MQWFKNFTYVALKNIYIQDFNSLIQKFDLMKKTIFDKTGDVMYWSYVVFGN